MKSKWVAVLLLLSLAVNLAMAGFIVGRSAMPGHAGDPTRGFPRWLHNLPQERRKELRPMVADRMREARPHMRALRQRHRALQQVLVAEPFVPDDLDAALREMRTQNSNLQQASHAAFMAFVQRLSSSEREALANDMRSSRRGPPGAHRLGP